MDNNYLNTLKNTELRPGRAKIKERKEVLLSEQTKLETLREIFSQSPAYSDLPAGPLRDMQILRTAIIAEYDAANLYEQMATQAADENISTVLKDIANEEKQHIGEFEFLLEHIDPMHETSENKGEDEAMEITGLGEPPGEED